MFTFDISLVRYRCQHSKINSISPRDHVLFSMYSRLRFSQLHFSTSTKMRRFIGHAVAGTMFLTISVWWFIGDVLQMNRRCGTVWKLVFAHWFHSFGKTPQKMWSSRNLFFLYMYWLYLFFMHLCGRIICFRYFLPKRTNWTNPFCGTIRMKGKRLRPRPDRMPDSEICHNTNKWGSYFSLTDEKKKCYCTESLKNKISTWETKSSRTFW